MRITHGALVFFALAQASWPGGPLAQAHIVAHGAPIDEHANDEHAAILAPPDDAVVETFDVIMVNTQERSTIRLVGKPGKPDAESLAKLKHLMRAFPIEKEGPFDPELVPIFSAIAKQTNEPIEIVSGYRLAKNRWDHNYHVRGQAADIRVRGVPVWKLLRMVRKLGVKGVGYYPTSGFVHVDTRDEPFSWTDWTGPSKER
jgi:uncharacterized protein YcbK (DUF882 family)